MRDLSKLLFASKNYKDYRRIVNNYMSYKNCETIADLNKLLNTELNIARGNNMATINFLLKNDLKELDAIHVIIPEFLASFQKDTYITLLILEEMVSNIIKHGYDPTVKEKIQVKLKYESKKSQLFIRITDSGKMFNPLFVPELDVSVPAEDRKIGGMGIFLVKQITDCIRYWRKQGKNVLLLSVNL